MDAGLKKIIQKSGNNLHLDMVDCLEHQGWSVDISQYYCDEFTDKPREIDIIATRKIQILIGAGSEDTNYWFKIVLFIECKHFTGDINFRVFDNDKKLSQEILCNQAHNLCLGKILKENGSYLGNHHYLTETKIAKLYDYCGTPRNEQQDDIFKAINQSIKSYIFFKEKKSEGARGSINYPLVVYDGIDGVYIMPKNNTDDASLDKLEKHKNIIFHLKYSYPKVVFGVASPCYITKDFYVDFIHKNELKDFLIGIEQNEIEKIKLFFGEVKNRGILK